MALKTCKTCGGAVAESVTKCLHCGEDLHTTGQWVVGFVITVIIAILLWHLGNAFVKEVIEPAQKRAHAQP